MFPRFVALSAAQLVDALPLFVRQLDSSPRANDAVI